jgi:hypothetical protein
MRTSVPMIDTTIEPMHPALLEKNPNMAKGKRGAPMDGTSRPFGR